MTISPFLVSLGGAHPLLVHFPIALVLTAAAAELVAIASPNPVWRTVAVINLRVGAALAVVTAAAGWLFALSPIVAPSPQFEWHRWLGIAAAVCAASAAALSSTQRDRATRLVLAYRLALFGAALLVGIAGHLGGTLVWGAPFQF